MILFSSLHDLAEWLPELARELGRRRMFRTAGIYVLVAWGVLQVSNEISQAWGLPPSVLGRTLFLVAALGLPVVLYLAWVWGPREEDAAREDAAGGDAVGKDGPGGNARALPSPPGARALALGLSSAVLLLLAVATSAALLRRQVRAAELRNVAVLPFHTQDPAYSGVGIADEITTALAAIPALRVASGTSTRDLAGPGREAWSARRIAETLGVGSLVEGAVRREAGRIRVVARLVDARRDRTVWSGSWAGGTADLPATWPRLAAAIADELGVRPPTTGVEGRLGPGARSEVRRPDTLGYLHYLKGREHFLRMTAEDATTAIHFFGEALERNSSFVPARAGLAQAYLARAVFQGGGGEVEALAEAEAAVRGDSSSAQAWTALGWARRALGRDGAAEAYRRALALRPSHALAASGLGALALAEGDWAGAVHWLSRAAALDPRNALYPSQLGHVFWRLGRLEEAEAAYRRAAALAPGQPAVYAGLAAVATLGGDTAGAREAVDRLLATDRSPATLTVAGDVATAIGDLDSARARYLRAIRESGDAAGTRGEGSPEGGDASAPGRLFLPWTKLSFVLLELGDPAAADSAYARARAQLEARTRRLGTSLFDLYERAELRALRGQADSAVSWLTEARERGWRDVGDAEADPMLAPLRGHPAFRRLMGELRAELDSVWREAREGLLEDWRPAARRP